MSSRPLSLSQTVVEITCLRLELNLKFILNFELSVFFQSFDLSKSDFKLQWFNHLENFKFDLSVTEFPPLPLIFWKARSLRMLKPISFHRNTSTFEQPSTMRTTCKFEYLVFCFHFLHLFHKKNKVHLLYFILRLLSPKFCRFRLLLSFFLL